MKPLRPIRHLGVQRLDPSADRPGSGRRPSLPRASADELLRVRSAPLGDADLFRDEAPNQDHAIDTLRAAHRVERAAGWVETLGSAAAADGRTPLARLEPLRGAGHSFTERACPAERAAAGCFGVALIQEPLRYACC